MTSTTKMAPNYDEEVDFRALAMIDPDFAKFYDDANGHVDFQDPKALQQVSHHLDRLQSVNTKCHQATYQKCSEAGL
jgi:PleD family two-component response regulator